MVDDATNDPGSRSRRHSKVGRVIDEYGLDGIGEQLARYWRGDDVERRSLRDLATYFNQQVLQSAMTDAGLRPLDGEASNTYRLLTADDVTSGARTKVERRLEREGVDVDDLRKDFVSHQAIHTYLTDVRGVALDDGGDEDPREKAVDRIQRLSSRSKAVSQNTIEGLVNQDEVAIGEHTVTVDFQVVCRDCNTQYDLVQFLERGRCECSEE